MSEEGASLGAGSNGGDPSSLRPRRGTRRTSIAAIAGVILGVAGIVFIGARQTHAIFVTDVLGPEGFLYFIVGGLALSAVVTVAIELRLEQRALADGVEIDGGREEISWSRFLALAAEFAVYLLVLPFLGFLISTAIYAVATAVTAGERSRVLLIAIALLVPLGFVVVFEVLLNVELPGGRTGLWGS